MKNNIFWMFMLLSVLLIGYRFGNNQNTNNDNNQSIDTQQFTAGFASEFDATKSQCGHHCLYRALQICGVPTSIPQLVEALPPKEQGHSFSDLVQLMESAGVQSEGIHMDYDGFDDEHVYISHLMNPSHFVLVVDAEPEHVELYDGSGDLMVTSREEFLSRWSGNVIRVRRKSGTIVPPQRGGPELRFSTLVIDRKNVPATGTPEVFEFEFENTGDAPLKISDISTTCSCTSVEYPEEVPPGEKGVVALHYSLQADSEMGQTNRKNAPPQYGPGKFSHKAHVESNDPNFPLVDLEISGTCDVSVMVIPNVIDTGTLICGVPTMRNVTVFYTGRGLDFNVEDFEMEVDGLTIEAKLEELDEHNKRQFMLGASSVGKLDLRNKFIIPLQVTANKPIHKLYGELKLKTNIPGFTKLKVPVIGKSIQPIMASPSTIILEAEKDQAPSISLLSRTERKFDIEKISIGGEDVEYKITQRSDEALEIEFDFNDQDLSPNDQIDVVLNVDKISEKVILHLPVLLDEAIAQ